MDPHQALARAVGCAPGEAATLRTPLCDSEVAEAVHALLMPSHSPVMLSYLLGELSPTTGISLNGVSISATDTGSQVPQRSLETDYEFLGDNAFRISARRKRASEKGRGRGNKGHAAQLDRASTANEDGYSWRKYGQKQIRGSRCARSYYRCSQNGCSAKKIVGQDPETGACTTTYRGVHHHAMAKPSQKSAPHRDLSQAASSETQLFAFSPSTPVALSLANFNPSLPAMRPASNILEGNASRVGTPEDAKYILGEMGYPPTPTFTCLPTLGLKRVARGLEDDLLAASDSIARPKLLLPPLGNAAHAAGFLMQHLRDDPLAMPLPDLPAGPLGPHSLCSPPEPPPLGREPLWGEAPAELQRWEEEVTRRRLEEEAIEQLMVIAEEKACTGDALWHQDDTSEHHEQTPVPDIEHFLGDVKMSSGAAVTEGSHELVQSPVTKRTLVEVESDSPLPEDGYRWRKYGQKMVKGHAHPRSYYRCTHPGCPMRKHVERNQHDPWKMTVAYEGAHEHKDPQPQAEKTRCMPRRQRACQRASMIESSDDEF